MVKNVLLGVVLRGVIVFFTVGFAAGFAVRAVLTVLEFELSLHDPPSPVCKERQIAEYANRHTAKEYLARISSFSASIWRARSERPSRLFAM